MIRDAVPADAMAISEIYNYYVLNTVVTFEEEPVRVQDMQFRIEEIQNSYPWLVFEENGKVVGYAYAGKWKVRSAYRFCAESSVYLKPGTTGRGIGRQLYSAVIDRLKLMGVHAVIGGAALPNDASIRLHESLGFRKIGQFHEVGFKMNRWVDVGYWELLLH